MAFESIDLQVSVPRTVDHAARQNLAAQKPVYDQTRLESDSAKHTEMLRTTNSAVEQSGMKRIKDDRKREGGRSSKERARAENGAAGQEEGAGNSLSAQNHPFKGQHIDITL